MSDDFNNGIFTIIASKFPEYEQFNEKLYKCSINQNRQFYSKECKCIKNTIYDEKNLLCNEFEFYGGENVLFSLCGILVCDRKECQIKCKLSDTLLKIEDFEKIQKNISYLYKFVQVDIEFLENKKYNILNVYHSAPVRILLFGNEFNYDNPYHKNDFYSNEQLTINKLILKNPKDFKKDEMNNLETDIKWYGREDNNEISHDILYDFIKGKNNEYIISECSRCGYISQSLLKGNLI